jgi:DNA-binding protein Fis
VEPLLIASALQATDGNQMAAAKLLGIHRSTLRERLKKNM